jgi:uncharacterized protein (DUF302 family)
MARRSTVVLGVVLLFNASAQAAGLESRETAVSQAPFPRVAEALEKAVAEEKMTLVCHADAQRGAAARGVTIRGNQVFMVFRNDFAVRLLAADPAAGFEAPLRIYVHENADGTTTVTYARPSVVFAPYQNHEVTAIAAELDRIFKRIVDRALAAR